MERESLYSILGVSSGATEEEITAAYRKLAMKHHPDREGGSEETFKRIKHAYDVLSDRVRRAAYDKDGISGADPVIEDEARRRKAIKILVSMCMRVIDRYQNPHEVDIFSEVRAGVREGQKKYREDMSEVQVALRKIELLNGRFKNKDGSSNPIQEYLDEEALDRKEKLRSLERDIALGEAVLELVDSMEFSPSGLRYLVVTVTGSTGSSFTSNF